MIIPANPAGESETSAALTPRQGTRSRRVEQARLTIRTRQTPIREVLDQIIDVVEGYSDRMSRRETDLRASGFRVPPGCGLAMLQDVALPGETQMADLAAALAEFADSGRAAAAEATAFGDADTAAVLTEVSRGIDYHHWLLESHLDRSVTIPRCDARRLAAYLATLRPQRTPAERRLRH